MKKIFKDIGWAVSVDGFSIGTGTDRDGAFGFECLSRENPKSHVVEYKVSAPIIGVKSGESYVDYEQSVRVQTREQYSQECGRKTYLN